MINPKEGTVKKKLLAAGAVLAAVAFIGQTASAKSLEDVLKEKGVISEADYKEVTKVKPLDYKLGKGFTFTSADEKYQLSVGGQMQIRYTLLDADRTDTGDKSQFALQRIKLNLNGFAFTQDLTYKIIFNMSGTTFDGNKTQAALEETYFNYRLIDEAQFRLGQDKIQYGRQWITPSGADQFVDVTQVTTAFIPGYDAGLAVLGKVANGLGYYQIGGYGGAGQNTLRGARDNAFAARIAVNPLGDMPYVEADVDYSKKPLASVGSSFYRNTVNPADQANDTSSLKYLNNSTGWFGVGRTAANLTPAQATPRTNESINFNTAEVDAAFKWLGFSAQAEYFWAQADGNTSKNTQIGQGYYIQTGYFIIPTKLEVAGRYSYLDPNRNLSNDHWVETAGAVSWYINKHNLKIQADYTNIHKQGRIASTGASSTASPTDDKQIRVQAQVLF